MAQHNWHWADSSAIVNTLTQQAWDCRKWDFVDWEMFQFADEMEKWKTVNEMTQIAGPCVCPRCRYAMDPRRVALSRLTRVSEDNRIYVCSSCGTEEAILQFHNNGIPVDWRE